MLYNGEDQVLYWADAVSEVACVVPSRKPKLPHVPHQTSAEISQGDSLPLISYFYILFFPLPSRSAFLL